MIYLYLVSNFNTWIKHKMNFNSYFINPFYKDSSRHDNSLDACLLCAPSRHVFTTLTISQPRGSAKWETAEISSSKGRGSRQKSSPLPRVTSAGSTALALARENKASMFFFGGDDEDDEKWPNRCSIKYFLRQILCSNKAMKLKNYILVSYLNLI